MDTQSFNLNPAGGPPAEPAVITLPGTGGGAADNGAPGVIPLPTPDAPASPGMILINGGAGQAAAGPGGLVAGNNLSEIAGAGTAAQASARHNLGDVIPTVSTPSGEGDFSMFPGGVAPATGVFKAYSANTEWTFKGGWATWFVTPLNRVN